MPGGLGQRQAHWRGVQAGLGPIRREQARWLPIRGRPYMSSPHGATWRSGYATVCKTVYSGSIPDVASINIISDLSRLLEGPNRARAGRRGGSRYATRRLAPGATREPSRRATRSLALTSAGGVPAFRKWNERPGQLVVIGRFRRRIERRRVGQKILLRSDGRSHGIQQTVEFSFAHRALRVGEGRISKHLCFQIELID